MKFAHLADCHLGGWNSPELNVLSLQALSESVSTCISEKVKFVLIAGDLFDSAYPSIETLKFAFKEFKRLKDSNIPVFLIAGSHDYSVSGKTFLEVLEKAGFCKDVSNFEERDGKIVLLPTIFEGVAIYGYPGRKSGLEVEEIKRVSIQKSPGMFNILMLHTAIKSAVKNNQYIESVDETTLPKADYVALGHLHIKYAKDAFVYPGPLFPNNISELEELKNGNFCIFENGKVERREISLKEVYVLKLEVKNTLEVTENIVSFLEKEDIRDKIVVLRLFGIIDQGKVSDIDFKKIEDIAKSNGAYSFLKSTTKLHLPESEIKISKFNEKNLEEEIIKDFESKNKDKQNNLIRPLIRALQIDKLEDERSSVFEDRLLSEFKKIIS